jgi:transcriptional antiterminator NusG
VIDESENSAEQPPADANGSAGGSSHPGASGQPAGETTGGESAPAHLSTLDDAGHAGDQGHAAEATDGGHEPEPVAGGEQARSEQASGEPAEPAAKSPRKTGPAKRAGEPLELDESDDTLKPTGNRDWYILKVQSNREDSIREALQRKIHMNGMEGFFGDIIVPIEMVSEFKNGKKRVVKRKLYPGYLVVHMELNEETWFMVRETHGIGDFTGSGGKPSPMLPHEVERILSKQEDKTAEAPKLNIKFRPGDRVKITEGTFENFEGDVDTIDEANGRVTVMINIFGRSTPVELEYWQVESL